jgi:foldase protein PrsA
MKNCAKYLVLLSAIISLFSCKKSVEEHPEAIARIDGESLTIEDFRLFYELDPNFGIDSSGYPALLDELHNYIDHTLAYRKAEQSGLTEDTLFQKARNWEERQAMLRQLYREKVEAQIEISEQELRTAYLKYNTQLHIRHLFTKDVEEARILYRRLQEGASFATLAAEVFQDTLLVKSGGDLGWIKAGDLDEDFADAALVLAPNEISSPVQTQWGYHIIQVLDRKDQVLLTEDDFNAQRRSLEKRIKRKKSRRLANEYIAHFMKDVNPQPVPQNFRLLWNAVVPSTESENSVLTFNLMFSDDLIQKAIENLGSGLEKPLVQYHGGTVSIKEYLDALKNEFPVSNRPRFRIRQQLSNHIGIWVRDRFLYREAKRDGLQNHPRVQQDVTEFINRQSYLYFLQKEVEGLEVPENIELYFNTKDKSILKEYPELPKFHTLQEWIWTKAERQLHQNLKSIEAKIEIDSKKLQEESKQINWNKRIRMFAIRKPS